MIDAYLIDMDWGSTFPDSKLPLGPTPTRVITIGKTIILAKHSNEEKETFEDEKNQK